MEKVSIEVNGDTVRYIGHFGLTTHQKFMDAVKGKKIAKIVISSEGGVVDSGMDMGDYIHKNGIDVEVDGICLSSCANYIWVWTRIDDENSI